MGNPAGSQPPQSTMAVAGNAAVHQQSSTSITHFSHPHPLVLSQQGLNTHCSGCKQFDASSGPIYTCTSCNYSLHQKCSQMPQTVTHPFDKNNHVLSLLTKPAYPDGTFTCDACGELGYGFNYHCQACGIDIHIICASSPMVITHPSHPHQLNLVFSPPYPMGTFSCDVCQLGGSKNWLYRCHICSFDVHLTCVNKPLPPSNPHLALQQSLPNQQFQHPLMTRSTSVPAPHNTPIMANNFVAAPGQYSSFPAAIPGGFQQFQPHPQTVSRVAVSPAIPYAAPPPMVNSGYNYGPAPGMFAGYGPRQQQGMGSQLANSMANGVASGLGQAVGTEMIQAMFGGGNGGNGGGGGGGGGGGNGGGGNDPTSHYNTGADGYLVDQGQDQGQYFVSDGSFSQMDGSGDPYSGGVDGSY